MSHPGVRATQRLVCQRYVFSGMKRKIKDLIKTCVVCQRSKVNRHTVSPITSIPMPSARFTKLQVDICGPFPSSQACSYLLVCIDLYTRWVKAYLMFDQSTESVITALNKHIQTFGTFSLLHTDSGSQFTSLTFRNYCKFLGAEHRLSSIRYPNLMDLLSATSKLLKLLLLQNLIAVIGRDTYLLLYSPLTICTRLI